MTYTDWMLTLYLVIFIVFKWFGNNGGGSDAQTS